MPTLATTKNPKQRLSVVLDFEKKQALENLAKEKNRSLNFVVIEMIDQALQQAKEQAEYEQWVENRVMAVYERVQKQGSNGKPASQVHAELKEKMKLYAQNK